MRVKVQISVTNPDDQVMMPISVKVLEEDLCVEVAIADGISRALNALALRNDYILAMAVEAVVGDGDSEYFRQSRRQFQIAATEIYDLWTKEDERIEKLAREGLSEPA
jgi:hypothetical protein